MKEVLLDVRHLRTWFPVRRGLLRRTTGYVHAVEDVSFRVGGQEVFALVGESGCGKSTTGASVLRLIEPTEGEVLFDGVNLRTLSAAELREKRRDMQFIFQNPAGALNPRMTAGALLAEPLKVHFPALNRTELREKVREMLSLVGMTPDQAARYPHQFSGGQRQRIAIARALISRPRFVVADEPVSALDVSIQAQILNLLMTLQREMRLSLIFISHDLNVVRHISDRVGVMYLGRIAEQGNTERIYENPLHPYTQALLSAVPSRDPLQRKKRLILEGDVPSPLTPPTGCPFHTRCPRAAPICREKAPETVMAETDHLAACHNL
ncbi:MAG: ATP-binding cassette domain-containing protein [Synergistaceae bacterium]|jgi:oligopeptide/dipeptide ABC transporter ATP-binding protein|nr:ATP-binding cassette domain-containing protein [Synergistaceae bacterium]